MHRQNTRQIQHTSITASPLVYNNMGGRDARPERRWGCRRGTPSFYRSEDPTNSIKVLKEHIVAFEGHF